ncbi:AAA family ATPase [Motilibacter deserti]|uniref:AAA family ATPase n=1 Tax=Motilibacter deserti TaxID=2714956 RepID=UPI002F2B1606
MSSPAPAPADSPLDVSLLDASGGAAGLRAGRDRADVARERERQRQRRLRRLALGLAPVAAWLWYRLLSGDPVSWGMPQPDWLIVAAFAYPVALIGLLLWQMRAGGKSPHTVVRPEQLDVTLDEVVGIDVVKDEVVRSLQLFLAHREFSEQMGGRPRRGLLFEGGPGTGKTHTAKALAAEAGVPFLFATGTSFVSGLQGASQRKVRQYFGALRKAARKHGGAVGFIDEFDAIAMTRSAMAATPAAGAAAQSGVLGCGGLEGLPALTAAPRGVATTAFTQGNDMQNIVNELLVQLQSFDEPTGAEKLVGKLVDAVNGLLPAHRQLRGPAGQRPNLLLIASTNRADALDPALLRPGRFDARLSFELPTKAGRRELVDHFLARKAHDAELDGAERRDALAAVTTGYSPAKLEGLLDEALVQALREGRRSMSWRDVERARMLLEVGLAQPVAYTEHEARLIATHEAGHATVAWLVAPQRRLEILTIVKRRDALGLLAHGDREDVFTRSRSELTGLVQIAMGGQVAEELFLGDVSTGPGGDLQYATTVAAQMVGGVGMDESLVSYLAVQGGALSDTNLVGRVVGDVEGRGRVERLLQAQKAAVHELLAANRHLVEALRDALLERHELVGSEITEVLEAAAARGSGEGAAVPGDVIDLRELPAPRAAGGPGAEDAP